MIFQQHCTGVKLIVQSRRYFLHLPNNSFFELSKDILLTSIMVFQEMVTVSVDGSVLDRIAKIMTYLRLGSSGKVLKKKKKEKEGKGSNIGFFVISRLFFWFI